MLFQANFISAVFVVVIFFVLIKQLGLISRVRMLKKHSEKSFRILKDSSLSDREKEKVFQNQARQLFILLVVLVGGNFLAIALPFSVVWGLERMGMSSVSETLSMLSRIDFLGGVFVLGLLAYLIRRYNHGF